MRRFFARRLLGEFGKPLTDLRQWVGAIVPDWDERTPYQRKKRWLNWVDRFEPGDENDRQRAMDLGFEIARAKDEPEPDTLNQRMIHRENLARLRGELAETIKRIEGRRISFAATAATSPVGTASSDAGKGRAGRTRALRNATIDFLRSHYRNGKPDAVSYDMIRAEMGGELQPSDKTIREAFKDILDQAK